MATDKHLICIPADFSEIGGYFHFFFRFVNITMNDITFGVTESFNFLFFGSTFTSGRDNFFQVILFGVSYTFGCWKCLFISHYLYLLINALEQNK